MNKLSLPLILVLAVAAAVCFNGWRGSRKSLETASTDFATSSNKLAEATVKLAEQGAANETLRVQLDLQKGDLAAVSNRVNAVADQLTQAREATKEVQGRLAKREAELAAARQTAVKLRESAERIEQLEARINQLAGELTAARKQIAGQAEQMAGLNHTLNAAEAEKSALLQKLSDPSVLRARLAALTAKPLGKTGKGPVTLKADGTVALVEPPQEAAK
jgi:chromosome segregation ATPase